MSTKLFSQQIHALGFDHMQNHADRDKYVLIQVQNIEPKHLQNFDKVSSHLFGNFETPYDYYSIMHYDNTAFSRNGDYTIIPRQWQFLDVIGKQVGLSRGDVKRLNTMYGCNTQATQSPNIIHPNSIEPTQQNSAQYVYYLRGYRVSFYK